MFVRLIAGSFALLAFSAALLAGLYAGNDVTTILLRAWWAMILFLVLGGILGWIAQIMITDHIDRSNAQLMEKLMPNNSTTADQDEKQTVTGGTRA
jgi:hypothetical protein